MVEAPEEGGTGGLSQCSPHSLPLQLANPSFQYGQPPAALAFQTQGAHVLLWEAGRLRGERLHAGGAVPTDGSSWLRTGCAF